MRSGKKRFGLASHPLMPAPIATPIGVRWVKRTHAWTGISTAILALIFAWSGFMLNHRTHFTLGAPAQTTQFTIPAPVAGFASPQELADFLDSEFELRTSPTLENRDATAPPAGRGMGMGQQAASVSPAMGVVSSASAGVSTASAGISTTMRGASSSTAGASTATDPSRAATGASTTINPSSATASAPPAAMGGSHRSGGGASVASSGPSFSAIWQAPGGDFSGDWVIGSSEIAVTQSDRGFNRIVNRLHSGRGLEGGSWHFIISAYAVMLLFLSLSGVMLWSHVSGTARMGGSLLGASLLLIGAWIVIGP